MLWPAWVAMTVGRSRSAAGTPPPGVTCSDSACDTLSAAASEPDSDTAGDGATSTRSETAAIARSSASVTTPEAPSVTVRSRGSKPSSEALTRWVPGGSPSTVTCPCPSDTPWASGSPPPVRTVTTTPGSTTVPPCVETVTSISPVGSAPDWARADTATSVARTAQTISEPRTLTMLAPNVLRLRLSDWRSTGVHCHLNMV